MKLRKRKSKEDEVRKKEKERKKRKEEGKREGRKEKENMRREKPQYLYSSVVPNAVLSVNFVK